MGAEALNCKYNEFEICWSYEQRELLVSKHPAFRTQPVHAGWDIVGVKSLNSALSDARSSGFAIRFV